MEDTDIQCSVCQKPFLFSAAEQAYYAQRGFQFPKRCRACRQARRKGGAATSRRIQAAPRREHATRATFSAACTECSTDVKLVFKPGEREILCADCFCAAHSG
jgi:hypothetical protein